MYNGDTNLDQSPYSTQPFVVNKAVTTTAAQGATATYSMSDQTVTLSANVTSMAGTVGEGQATFTLLGNDSSSPAIAPDTVATSGTVIGTPVMVNVASGAISTPYTIPGGTAAGSYTIDIDFGGSNDFVASSDTKQLTLQPAPTTTTVTVAALPFSATDSTVNVSAAVSSTAGTVEGGSVTFTILSRSRDPIDTPVMANLTDGSASTSVTVPGGTKSDVYTIEADFGGTTNFQMSSGTNQLAVSAPDSPTPTIAAASVTVPFSASNQTVGLSASVTVPSPASVDGGTVIFTIQSGSATIGTPVPAPVSAAASASYVVPAGTAPGSYTIEADYVGTVSFLNSSDSKHSLVVQATTIITAMSTSATFSASDQSVPLTASVTERARAPSAVVR